MVQSVSHTPLSVRSAPPEARTRPAQAGPELPQDAVVLGASAEGADAPRPIGWKGLGLLGLAALTLVGCAGIPGFVGGAAVQPASISRTVEQQTPSVFQNVFSKPYPRPAGWVDRQVDLGATSYRTISPPSGWTFGQAGQGFQITKDGEPGIYLQVQNVESATGLGDLQSVLDGRKQALREQGMDLREVDAAGDGRDFFVSVNEFERGGETWRAELFVNSDLGDDTQNYAATVTTIVYRAGEDADVFPTVLQATVKTINTNMPMPQVR